MNTPSANVSGTFAFQGTSYSFPILTLDVNGPALQNIADTLWQQITKTINALLKNPDQWLSWVHSGVITGADKSAEGIVKILYHDYQLSATDITTKMEQIMGFGAADIAQALLAEGVGTAEQGAKGTASDVTQVLGQGVDTITHGINDLKHLL